jgi:YD repeat-containing protein
VRCRMLVLLLAASAAVPSNGSETTTYTYDSLGRLIVTSNAGGPRDGKTISTRFDPVGNRDAVAVGLPLPTPISNAAIFSISGPSPVNEGQVATFTVTKSGTSSSVLTVNFATANGSAVAPGDFAAVSGTLSFQPWETLKTINVLAIDDGAGEAGEQFYVSLSSPSSGASLGTASAAAIINANGAANQPPVANTDFADAEVCTNVDVNIIANDTDPDGNYPLAIASLGTPTFGSVIWLNSTTIRFRSGSGGDGSVSYVVTDSLGATATGIVYLSASGVCQ